MKQSPRPVDGPLLPSTENSRACAFYATNDAYAVAVLVAARRLKQLGIADAVDLVVLHTNVSPYLVNLMREAGLLPILSRSPRPAAGRTFRDSLLKLRVFQMVQYERVVFMDADALPWSNLESLFALNFHEPVALPVAYWLNQPYGTTALMVAQPSVENWHHILSWIDASTSAGRRIQGDMDVVNLAFDGCIHYLPGDFLCLNGDWNDRQFMPIYGDPDAAVSRLHVVHFTDLGKPWFYRPATVRRRRSQARPFYYESWDCWWKLRDEILRSAPPFARVRLSWLKQRNLLWTWLRDRLKHLRVRPN